MCVFIFGAKSLFFREIILLMKDYRHDSNLILNKVFLFSRYFFTMHREKIEPVKIVQQLLHWSCNLSYTEYNVNTMTTMFD